MNASMVKIESKAENELIVKWHQANSGDTVYYWLAGRNVFVDDSIFQWTDGSPVAYANWMNGEPNTFNHKSGACINMWTHTGEWHDYYCSGYPYIRQLCEKKIDCTVLKKQDEETRNKFSNYCEKDIEYRVNEIYEKIDALKKFMYKYFGEDPNKLRNLLKNITSVKQ
ncbi:hypothetical protein B4U80_12276 [Leptotrombidium deliense]|uniref:C-type lectin domain-containing protein n=1 Tax=Leptotrombidium deliense TaxID=299467 RepID=A0A443RVY9_9ACAR|nr:hypothetical protein B4U80_12276 [Leptotrombidium deliense]